MWRAEVIERIAPGRVVVKIPDLFREDPVGPMQSAIDVEVGELVVVTDLHPDARVRDWWVAGYVSTIGRWGTPYAHTHPVGQITGVNATGQETTLTELLAAKANVEDIPEGQDLSGYVTDAELSTTLSSYTTDSELSTTLNGYATTTALNAKANGPGAWSAVSSSYWTPDTAESRPLSFRSTPFGMQMAGRVRLTAAVSMDLVVATIPSAFTPPYPIIINVPAMGPGSAYAALKYQFELQINGTITARESMLSGARLSFHQTLMF